LANQKRKLSRPILLKMAIEGDDSDDGPILVAAMVRLVDGLKARTPDYVAYGLNEAAAAEILWCTGRLAEKLRS